MGLDMYLEKRTYVQRWDHIPADKQFTVTVMRGGKPYPNIDMARVSHIVEQVAYWRKANAIHAWFVREVAKGEDDCEPVWCSREKLAELRDLVAGLLADRDATRAATALPTQSGFFFGSTEYGEDYWLDLTDTERQLNAALAEPSDSREDFYYRASW
jgi:hypothetical protein